MRSFGALHTRSAECRRATRGPRHLSRALRYLRGCQPNETYSVALQTLVFCQLGAAGDLPRIRRNVEWLVDSQKKGAGFGGQSGAWGYGGGRSSGDPSNAQFAILAFGAAQDRGVEVDPAVFQRALQVLAGATKRQRRLGIRRWLAADRQHDLRRGRIDHHRSWPLERVDLGDQGRPDSVLR